MARELGLGRRDRNSAAVLHIVLLLPHVVVVQVLGFCLWRREEDLARADHAHVFDHLLRLVLRRHESRLRLRPVGQRVDLVLWSVVRGRVVLVRVVARVELARAEALEELDLGVGEAQVLVVDLVVHVAPRLVVVALHQVVVQRVPPRLLHQLLPLAVVADVLLVLVPLHRDVPHRVAHQRTVLIRVALRRDVPVRVHPHAIIDRPTH
mmetsp:Transcript_22178/g.53207  ORF Transcript_22178/g.53207 Transcript_22178/m.53207 type:complete len:208 (-) Transcript_22178:98-721(-)